MIEGDMGIPSEDEEEEIDEPTELSMNHVVVVDNLPVVDESKYERLTKILAKVTGGAGNVVQAYVDEFARAERMAVTIAPEGTRSKVNGWKREPPHRQDLPAIEGMHQHLLLLEGGLLLAGEPHQAGACV